MEPYAWHTIVAGTTGHPAFLFVGFNRARTNGTHIADGLGGGPTAFRQHQSGDRAGAAEATAAMHDNATAALQCAMQLSRKGGPPLHGVVCGGVQIRDRKVEPVDTPRLHGLAELGYAQHIEFVVLDQAQDGVGTPSLDRVHVEIKVSIPRGAKDTVAFLAGTKRDAQPSVSEGQVINAQGVGDTRSNQSRLLLISIRFDTRS